MSRRDKENYYLDIAQTVAERGTCLRRNFGAIIVKNDQILSTGYAGAPRGRKKDVYKRQPGKKGPRPRAPAVPRFPGSYSDRPPH